MKDYLLSLARASIKSHFTHQMLDTSVFEQEYSALQEGGACFVTLTLDNELRGCIGSVVAHRKLLDDVIDNAKSAAFRDPRFPSLSEDELDRVVIEVSVLSKPEVLEYTDFDDLVKKVRIGIDGIVLRFGNFQSTFLPQVWESLPTHELFFSHLCQKAGLESDCIKHRPQIQTYQVQKVVES